MRDFLPPSSKTATVFGNVEHRSPPGLSRRKRGLKASHGFFQIHGHRRPCAGGAMSYLWVDPSTVMVGIFHGGISEHSLFQSLCDLSRIHRSTGTRPVEAMEANGVQLAVSHGPAGVKPAEACRPRKVLRVCQTRNSFFFILYLCSRLPAEAHAGRARRGTPGLPNPGQDVSLRETWLAFRRLRWILAPPSAKSGYGCVARAGRLCAAAGLSPVAPTLTERRGNAALFCVNR